jgi:hypothetical protein
VGIRACLSFWSNAPLRNGYAARLEAVAMPLTSGGEAVKPGPHLVAAEAALRNLRILFFVLPPASRLLPPAVGLW